MLLTPPVVSISSGFGHLRLIAGCYKIQLDGERRVLIFVFPIWWKYIHEEVMRGTFSAVTVWQAIIREHFQGLSGRIPVLEIELLARYYEYISLYIFGIIQHYLGPLHTPA